MQGDDLQTLIPHERMGGGACFRPGRGCRQDVRYRFGGFLPGVDLFDAAAFRWVALHLHEGQRCMERAAVAMMIQLQMAVCVRSKQWLKGGPLAGVSTCVLRVRRLSHSEASLMDPQSRILLEQASLALTDTLCAEGTPRPCKHGRLCRRHAHGVHPAFDRYPWHCCVDLVWLAPERAFLLLKRQYEYEMPHAWCRTWREGHATCIYR